MGAGNNQYVQQLLSGEIAVIYLKQYRIFNRNGRYEVFYFDSDGPDFVTAHDELGGAIDLALNNLIEEAREVQVPQVVHAFDVNGTWEGLYVNGDLKVDASALDAGEVLDAIDVLRAEITVDLPRGHRLPRTLEDAQRFVVEA